jgi:hypothetical protein
MSGRRPDGRPATPGSVGGLGGSRRRLQHQRIVTVVVAGDAEGAAWAESAADLGCVEPAAGGLPIDRAIAGEIIASIIGGPPGRLPGAWSAGDGGGGGRMTAQGGIHNCLASCARCGRRGTRCSRRPQLGRRG